MKVKYNWRKFHWGVAWFAAFTYLFSTWVASWMVPLPGTAHPIALMLAGVAVFMAYFTAVMSPQSILERVL